jgi:predicted nuclease of predicted toxin-antitoxin system
VRRKDRIGGRPCRLSSSKVILPLFLDEGAPKSVGKFFIDRGHDVTFLAEAIARGSPDLLVAEVAVRSDAILVAVDKDMRQIAKRHGVGSIRFKRLNLLQFRCTAVQSIHRAKEAYSLIEHEWGIARTKTARRFWVEIGNDYIRTHR